MSARPLLYQDQPVDVGITLADTSTRWFASRVTCEAGTAETLQIAWPMDANRFLPVLLPLVASDLVLLTARGANGQVYGAPAIVEQADADQLRLTMRLSGAWGPTERRVNARRSTNIRPKRAERLRNGARQPIDSTIQNLSAGGVLLHSRDAVEPGETLELVFTPPMGGEPIVARVTVLRSLVVRGAHGRVWEAGCEFEQLAPADYERLAALNAGPAVSGARRWLSALVGATLLASVLLSGRHLLPDDMARIHQPALASLSVRPALTTRPVTTRARTGSVWSAYGYAIQAPEELWPALEAMREMPGHDWVLDALNSAQTTLDFGDLPPGTMGLYNGQQNTILIATPLQTANVHVVAATLVHEATHLSDALHGRWENSSAACLNFEQRAFANESAYWHAVVGPRGKANPSDEWETSLNGLQLSGGGDPLAVQDAYSDECGSLPMVR